MTIQIYPEIVRQNDLSPDHGGSKVDELCEQIHGATKGWGVSDLFVVSWGRNTLLVTFFSYSTVAVAGEQAKGH